MANDHDGRGDLGMWLGEELRCAWLAAGYTSQDQFARELGLYVRLAGIARKSNGPIPGVVRGLGRDRGEGS
jgi:hypothetical protein